MHHDFSIGKRDIILAASWSGAYPLLPSVTLATEHADGPLLSVDSGLSVGTVQGWWALISRTVGGCPPSLRSSASNYWRRPRITCACCSVAATLGNGYICQALVSCRCVEYKEGSDPQRYLNQAFKGGKDSSQLCL